MWLPFNGGKDLSFAPWMLLQLGEYVSSICDLRRLSGPKACDTGVSLSIDPTHFPPHLSSHLLPLYPRLLQPMNHHFRSQSHDLGEFFCESLSPTTALPTFWSRDAYCRQHRSCSRPCSLHAAWRRSYSSSSPAGRLAVDD